jgi:hypothetical protein
MDSYRLPGEEGEPQAEREYDGARAELHHHCRSIAR